MNPPKNRTILYVDMNAYFASCEQAEDKRLWGKPVIVVPTEGSCALSASYEAKTFGIRTGTLEKEARFLCPELVAVPARPKLYMDYHYRLKKILESVSPQVLMKSVDEAAIKLCSNDEPQALAQEVKEKIWTTLSPALHCSIGIASNIFQAKLATDMRKPNGLMEILLEDLEEVYAQVSLRELCGINYAMERQLQRVGIYSVLDFFHAPPHFLRQHFGILGERWWLRLHGYALDADQPARKSLSHSHVLPPMYRLPDAAYATLQRLVTKVGRRLRREGCMACHLNLYVRYVDRQGDMASLRIRPTSDTLVLSHHVQGLWRTLQPNRPVLKLGLWTSSLVPACSVPPPLFPNEQKIQRISQALDTINDRYGTDTIIFALSGTAGSRAPDRIAFNSLFTIEHE